MWFIQECKACSVVLRNGQADSKIHMDMQRAQNSQNNLEREEFPISKLTADLQ